MLGRLFSLLILIFAFESYGGLGADPLSPLERARLQELIQRREFGGLVSNLEAFREVTFAPARPYSYYGEDPNSLARSQLYSTTQITTTPYGYLGILYAESLAKGSDPLDPKSDAYFLEFVLEALRSRGAEANPVIEFQLTNGKVQKDLLWNSVLYNAIGTNAKDLLRHSPRVLKKLGYSLSGEFPYITDAGERKSAPFIYYYLGYLGMAALGDEFVTQSELQYEGSRNFFNSFSEEELRRLGEEWSKSYEPELNDLDKKLRQTGRPPMSAEARTLERIALQFQHDFTLAAAMREGFDLKFPSGNLNYRISQQAVSIAAERIPAYLETLKRVMGPNGIRQMLNSPFIVAGSDPDGRTVMISPTAVVASPESPTRRFLQLFLDLGGDPNGPAQVFGQSIQIKTETGVRTIVEPNYRMNQPNLVMSAVQFEDLPTLKRLVGEGGIADFQIPSGFRPTVLHMALGGGPSVRFQDLSESQKRELQRNPASMRAFLAPTVAVVEYLLQQGADPDRMSEYFSPEGQIWYNMTEFQIGRAGTPDYVAKAMAQAVAPLFDRARVRLGRSERCGVPGLAVPGHGVCQGVIEHFQRCFPRGQIN